MVLKLAERWVRLRVPVADAVVAGCLLTVMGLSVASKAAAPGQRPGDVLAYLLALALSVPYLAHRRYPMQALALILVAFGCFAGLRYAAYPGFGVFANLYGIAAHTDRRRSVLALAGAVVFMVFGLLVQPAGVITGSDITSSMLAVAVAWLFGELQRSRRARWVAMQERADRLEREREAMDRQAAADERLRIARELHDVVAHSMSVIAIQSGVGRHLLDSDLEEARRALAIVETTSRSTLTEMRRLLGVLRQEDADPAELTPTAGLADLDALLSSVRQTGLAVSLTHEGSLDDLPVGLDLSAYRLVQEALTNVIKHGGPVAFVTVRRTAEHLVIEVTDDGRRHAEPDQATATHPSTHASGHGLIGMRERVACFAGDFSAGPRPGGGFQVTARLPLEPAPAVGSQRAPA